mgnify:CR=1 FL=1
MKTLISLLALSMLMASCAHVYFTDVQPRKGQRLMEIPTELHGTWHTLKGSTEIHAKGITILEMIEDSTETGTEIREEYKYMNLSEDFQLYQSKDLYVFNLRESRAKYWEFGMLQKKDNGDINYYTCNDPNSYLFEKNLKLIEAKYTDGEEEKTFSKMQNNSELTLEHVVFKGKMDHNTLVKLLVQENLMNIYKKDGTIENPNY